MDDRLMCINNNDKEKYPFSRLRTLIFLKIWILIVWNQKLKFKKDLENDILELKRTLGTSRIYSQMSSPSMIKAVVCT